MDLVKNIHDGGEVSTHEAVAEKLRELQEASSTPVEMMDRHEIPSLGLIVRVGPLSYKDHIKWHNLRRFEDRKHIDSKLTEADPVDRMKSDEFILARAVFTDDGQPLGSEMAAQLLSLPAVGPDLYVLLSHVGSKNPPREEMATEVAFLLNKSAIDQCIWEILFECGLSKALLDFISTFATEEERQWAASQLAKAEECVYVFSPMLQAKETASILGITLRHSFSLIAEHGSSDAAITAYLSQKSEQDAESEGTED